MRLVNKAGLDLIKSFEKCVLHPYDDGAGYMTIGWGHLIKRGEHFDKITQAEADELLRDDLADAEGAVERLVRVPLNNNQHGALVSFTFNVGGGGLARSSLLKSLNAGKYAEVPERLMVWNKAGGKVLAGLTRRRREEGKLFMTPAATTDLASAPPAIAPVPNSGELDATAAVTQTPAAVADIQPAVPAIEPVAGGTVTDEPVKANSASLVTKITSWGLQALKVGGIGTAIGTASAAITSVSGLSERAQLILVVLFAGLVVLAVLAAALYFIIGALAALWDHLQTKALRADPTKTNVK